MLLSLPNCNNVNIFTLNKLTCVGNRKLAILLNDLKSMQLIKGKFFIILFNHYSRIKEIRDKIDDQIKKPIVK